MRKWQLRNQILYAARYMANIDDNIYRNGYILFANFSSFAGGGEFSNATGAVDISSVDGPATLASAIVDNRCKYWLKGGTDGPRTGRFI